MRKTVFLLIFVTASLIAGAQTLEGKWKGYYTAEPPVMGPALPLFPEKAAINNVERTSQKKVEHRSAPKPTPPDYFANRLPSNKVDFEVHCIMNSDSTYQFVSYTGGPLFVWTKMEYEIIANGTLYLAEVGEKEQHFHQIDYQKMMLHISWVKRKGKKVLRMKDPWYSYSGFSSKGEVVLFRQN